MKLNTKIKTLLALGVVTITTASSMIPVNALSKDSMSYNCENKSIYLSINGNEFKLPLDILVPSNLESLTNFNFGNMFDFKSLLNLSTDNIIVKNIPNIGLESNQDNEKTTDSNNTTVVNKPSIDNTVSEQTNNNDNKTEANKTEDKNTTNKTEANKTEDQNTANKNEDAKVEQDNSNAYTEENKTTEKETNTSNNNAQSGSFASYQREVVDIVNAERSKRGLSPLTLDSELSRVATMKSQDMINKGYFDHTSPTYGSPFDMMKQFGISYKAAGENIAMGQKDPADVMDAWMHSEGHKRNILSPDFTHIGVGIAKASNGQLYWTQMFIGK